LIVPSGWEFTDNPTLQGLPGPNWSDADPSSGVYQQRSSYCDQANKNCDQRSSLPIHAKDEHVVIPDKVGQPDPFTQKSQNDSTHDAEQQHDMASGALTCSDVVLLSFTLHETSIKSNCALKTGFSVLHLFTRPTWGKLPIIRLRRHYDALAYWC
jgi:hypothetical protein